MPQNNLSSFLGPFYSVCSRVKYAPRVGKPENGWQHPGRIKILGCEPTNWQSTNLTLQHTHTLSPSSPYYTFIFPFYDNHLFCWLLVNIIPPPPCSYHVLVKLSNSSQSHCNCAQGWWCVTPPNHSSLETGRTIILYVFLKPTFSTCLVYKI